MLLPTINTALQVIAYHPSWLYAAAVPLSKNKKALDVYRSAALPKSDDWYSPVEKYIFLNRASLVSQEIVADASMMFGEAEHTIWTMEEDV